MVCLIAFLVVVFVLVIVVLSVTVSQRNSLMQSRNKCDEVMNDIDAEVKRRNDLITKMEETVREFLQHEKRTLTEIARLRSKPLGASATINVIVESYPELKGNENVLKLQQELTTSENLIEDKRLAYNESVKHFNDMIDCFPSNVVAGTIGLRKREYLEPGKKE